MKLFKRNRKIENRYIVYYGKDDTYMVSKCFPTEEDGKQFMRDLQQEGEFVEMYMTEVDRLPW